MDLVCVNVSLYALTGKPVSHASLRRAESDDGTILFRFGDEELKKHTPVSGSISDTQQSEAGIQRHASKSKTPKAVAEAAQSIASTESHSIPSNTGSAPAELPTQQTALTDSEVELNGHNSSVDTSDAEDSDTSSERLADMTPEQLENLKVFSMHIASQSLLHVDWV